MPVEIRVLDFELPAPKGYLKPALDYRVSSYNYYAWDIILAYNGGDIRQVFAAYANYRREDTAWRHEGCLRHWTDEEDWTIEWGLLDPFVGMGIVCRISRLSESKLGTPPRGGAWEESSLEILTEGH